MGLFSFRKKTKSRWSIDNQNPRRYDCRKEYWGHRCTIDNDTKFDITEGPDIGSYWKCDGHLSPCVHPGDEIIQKFQKGDVVLRVVEVENCNDPKDMFFATLKAIGYLREDK